MKPLNNGIRELINEYFKIDVLDEWPMTPETKENIIKTFTYAWERHQSVKSVAKQLQHSNLSELRDRIIKQIGSDYNPFPIRLGVLKSKLQQEACTAKLSLHRYILVTLKQREI
jgi:hypothetical protein